MVVFETFEGDNDYIEIRYTDLMMIVTFEERKNNDIAQETYKIHWALNEYTRKNDLRFIGAIGIRKDSILGKFILNNKNRERYVNKDLLITYDNIVNALNIAMFEDNEIVKDILPLFKNREQGFYDELSKKYDDSVLKYIMNNRSFGRYLSKIDGKTEYKPSMYGYENGKIIRIGYVEPKDENLEETSKESANVKVKK